MNEFKFLIIKIVTRCRNEMSIAMEWNNIWSLPDHFLELLKKFESWTFRVAIPLTVPMLPIPLSVRGKDPHFVASSVTSWSSIDFKNMCTWFMIACSFIHLDSRQLKFAYDFFFWGEVVQYYLLEEYPCRSLMEAFALIIDGFIICFIALYPYLIRSSSAHRRLYSCWVLESTGCIFLQRSSLMMEKETVWYS